MEAPRDRLLPPPETSYAANTTRVQILEVVPYSSLFPGDDEVEGCAVALLCFEPSHHPADFGESVTAHQVAYPLLLLTHYIITS